MESEAKNLDITKSGPLTYRELQTANQESLTGLSPEYQEHIKNIEANFAPTSLFDAREHSEQLVQSSLADSATPWGESMFDESTATEAQFQKLGDIRADNQPGIVQIGSGVAKGALLAGTTFIDGTVGLLYGGVKAIQEQRFSAIWDNDFMRATKALNEAAENALPNYYTEEELNSPWYTNILTPNWLGDKLIKNMGFTVGAFMTGNLVSSGIHAVGRFAFSTAKALNASISTLKTVASVTDNSAAVLGSVIATVNEGRAEAINNATDEFYKPYEEEFTRNHQKNLEALRKEFEANKGKSFSKVGSEEEGNVEFVDNAYIKYQDAVAKERANYEASIAHLKETMQYMGNVDLAFNVPILMASNLFQFAKYWSNGFKTARKTMNITGPIGAWKSGSSKLGVAGAFAKGFFSEGTEEITQKMASEISGDYYGTDVSNFYRAQYDEDAAQDTLDWVKSFATGICRTAGDINSWEEFFIGGVTGFLGMPVFTRGSSGKIKMSWQGGGIIEAKDYINNWNKEKEVAEHMNNRFNDPKFKNYWQGLVRHNKFQGEMDKAVLENDEFSFKNAEFEQAVSDILLFDKAGKLESLKEAINSISGTSVENLEAVVANTTAKTADGKLVGPFAQYAALDNDGNIIPNIGTAESQKAIADKLNANKKAIFDTIDKYQKYKDMILSLPNSSNFSDDQTAELIWMSAQLENWSDRATEMASETKAYIKKLIAFNSTIIETLSQLRDKEDSAHVERTELYDKYDTAYNKRLKFQKTLEKLSSKSDEELGQLFSNTSNKKFIEGLISDISGLNSKYLNPMEKNSVTQKLKDYIKTGLASDTFHKKLTEYMKNPEKQAAEHARIDNERLQQEKEKQIADLETQLTLSDYADFRNTLDNYADAEIKDATLKKLADSGNQMAKHYIENSSYYNNARNKILNSNIDDATKQDALALLSNLYENSETLEQLANPASPYISNSDFFEETSADANIAQKRFLEAQYEVQKALSQVNSDEAFKSRFTDDYRKAPEKVDSVQQTETNTVEEQTSDDDITPVGDITDEEIIEENAAINDSISSQQQPRKGEVRRYYKPSIPELHIAKSKGKDGDFRAFDIVEKEVSGLDFSDVYKYLEDAGAFEYLNSGKLKAGDKVKFMIDPAFEEATKDKPWHTTPTIFIVTEDGKQVLGVLDSGNSDSFEGLTALRKKIIDEYTQTRNQTNEKSNKSPKIIEASSSDVSSIIDSLDFDNNYYVIHQTHSEAAESIANTGFRSQGGLVGTSVKAGKDSLREILNQVLSEEGGPHQHSDALVILEFPKSWVKGDKFDLDDFPLYLMEHGHPDAYTTIPTEYIKAIVVRGESKSKTEKTENTQGTNQVTDISKAEKENLNRNEPQEDDLKFTIRLENGSGNSKIFGRSEKGIEDHRDYSRVGARDSQGKKRTEPLNGADIYDLPGGVSSIVFSSPKLGNSRGQNGFTITTWRRLTKTEKEKIKEYLESAEFDAVLKEGTEDWYKSVLKKIDDIMHEEDLSEPTNSDNSINDKTNLSDKPFIASPTTKVSKMMVGKVPHYKSTENKNTNLKDIYNPASTKEGEAKPKTPPKPVFAIVRKRKLITNGAVDKNKIIPIGDDAKKEGRLYLLIPNGAGMYSPVAIRVKHFNISEFNVTDPNSADSTSPIGKAIISVLNKIVSVQNSKELNEAVNELIEYIYLGHMQKSERDVNFNWYSDDSGTGIIISRKVRSSDGFYVHVNINNKQHIKEERTKIVFTEKASDGTVTETDATQRYNKILETLLSFNLPMQVSIKNINEEKYNNSLINSGILYSNIPNAESKGTWFTMDYFDNDGNIHDAENPPSIIRKPTPKNENPVSGTESAVTGTKITLLGINQTFYVDTKKNIITNEKGQPVPITPVNRVLFDLAWAQENFGDKTYSSVMIDNKVLTPGGRVLDRTTQKYLPDNEADEIKKKLKGTQSTESSEDRIALANKTIDSINENQKAVDKSRTDSEHYWILEEDGEYHAYDRVHKVIGSNRHLSEAQLRALENISRELDELKTVEAYDEYVTKLANKYLVNLTKYKGRIDKENKEGIIAAIKEGMMSSKHGNRALEAGNSVDSITRQFFMGVEVAKIQRPSNMSQKAFDDLITTLTEIKSRIELAGERFLTNNIVLYHKYADGTRVAGEVDILAIDKNGNFKIYDLKTSGYARGFGDWFDSKSEMQSMTTREYYTLQLSSYKNLFESQYGLPITNLAIMPFVLDFADDDSIRGIIRLGGIHITYNPNTPVRVEGRVKDPAPIAPAPTTANTNASSTPTAAPTTTTTTESKPVTPVNNPAASTSDTNTANKPAALFDSTLELQNPEEVLSDDSKIDSTCEVGYFELEGKIHKGYLKPIGTRNGNTIYLTRIPVYSRGLESKGDEKLYGYYYYIVLPNGKTINPFTDWLNATENVNINEIMSLINNTPNERFNELSKSKTLLYDPASEVKKPVDDKPVTPANIHQEENQKDVNAVNNKLEDSEEFDDDDITPSDDDDPIARLRDKTTDEYKIWDKDRETEWLSRVLPQLSTEERLQFVEGLIKVANSGGGAWGMFSRGIITLSDIAAEGTLYHEAFHAVFHLLMSPSEREGLLSEYRSKHPNMDDIGLEEELAEDFREFVMQGGKDTRSLGRKILDFFKSLFMKIVHWDEFTPSSIYYFRAINEGKYAGKALSDTSANRSRQEVYTQEMMDILNNAPRDSEGHLLAPNGKPTNLTERQYVHVRTKAFKEWFGDWENNPEEASKVVDENGEPLVVYHGGASGINIFHSSTEKSSTTGFGTYTDKRTGEVVPMDSTRTMFFSSNPFVAKSYQTLYGLNQLNTLYTQVESLIYEVAESGKVSIDTAYIKDWEQYWKVLDQLSEFNPRFTKLKQWLQQLRQDGKKPSQREVDAYRKLLIETRKAIRPLIEHWLMNNSEWENIQTRFKNILDEYDNPEGIKRLKQGEIPAELLKEFEIYKKIEQQREKEGKDKVSNYEEVSISNGKLNSLSDPYYTFSYNGKTLSVRVNKYTKVDISTLSEQEIAELFKKYRVANEQSFKITNSSEDYNNVLNRGKTYAVFLNIRNPFKHDYEGTHQGEGYKQSKKYSFGYVAARQVNKAIKDGNDGVIYENIYDPYLANNYGVFNSNQIKSATDNIGTYSSENADIRYRMADSPEERLFKQEAQRFLKNFGITIKEYDEYDDSEMPLFDALNRVINVRNANDLSEGMGYAIAFMMQYNKKVMELIGLHKRGVNSLSLKAVRRSIKKRGEFEMGLTKNDIKSLDRQTILKEIGKDIAFELRKLYNLETTDTSNKYIKTVWDAITAFFDLLTPKFRTTLDVISHNLSSIANAVKLNDTSIIRNTDYKPGTHTKASRVNIGQALKENPYEDNIIRILQSYNIALAGSASIALSGRLLRPVENPLHDIDFNAAGHTRKSLDEMLEKEFKHFIHTNRIDNGEDGITETYLIMDREFTVEKPEGSAYYILKDTKGNKIGAYIKSNLTLEEGVQGKFLDFFTGASRYGKHTQRINGRDYLISDARNALYAKVTWARNKDIWDYNNYVDNETLEELEKETTERDKALKEKFSKARVIWGHPTLGKTTYLERNDDILEWDSLINKKRDEFIRDQIDPQHTMDTASSEYRKLRSKYMMDWKEHPEYVKFLTDNWNALLAKAKRENKRVFASPVALLEIGRKDIDLIIAVDDKTFRQRDVKRGNNEMSSRGWKQAIDRELTTQDQSKIFYTADYLSDFMRKQVGVSWGTLTEEEAEALESRGWSKEMFNSISQKERENAVKCMAF